MLIMSTMILTAILLISVIGLGIRLAWGAAKFVFGLGLFWLCPILFVMAVMLGGFAHLWLPILIVGLLFGRGYRRF